MSIGKFGLRIIYKDGRKDFEWFIEEKLRDAEFKRYKRHWGVLRVKRVNK